MSVWIVKHVSQNGPHHLLSQVEYYTAPGEDLMSYTQKELAKRCGFNYKSNKGEVITITLRD